MGLKKSEQDLKRNLNGIAISLEEICVELGRLASQLSDAEIRGLTIRIDGLRDDVDRLKMCADEVRTGWIARVKV